VRVRDYAIFGAQIIALDVGKIFSGISCDLHSSIVTGVAYASIEVVSRILYHRP
jgi:hypothetical protein